jgi:hypothetical protein
MDATRKRLRKAGDGIGNGVRDRKTLFSFNHNVIRKASKGWDLFGKPVLAMIALANATPVAFPTTVNEIQCYFHPWL